MTSVPLGEWRPGRDRRAERIAGPEGRLRPGQERTVGVVGGGIAGLAAATALSERGVDVTLFERRPQLGGRVRSWPVPDAADGRTMSRGFHAFFRQYYNLRALLRRADPALSRLRPIADYPLQRAGGQTDSFAGVPRTPPWNLAGFVVGSPSFTIPDLIRIDLDRALALLDVEFPQSFTDLDGVSAADYLDRLRFPDRARHLALEVFARSFFADPSDFAAGELVAMFHSYFVGSAEGLLFDVPDDDYDSALWRPLGDHLRRRGVTIRTGVSVTGLDLSGPGVRIGWCGPGSAAATQEVDAVVIATDPPSLRALIGSGAAPVQRSWQRQVAGVRSAPPFAVRRLWLDRPVRRDRPPFLGTSGYGPLDNISVLDRFEAGARSWTARHGGSVIELHGYALPASGDDADRAVLKRRLWASAVEVWPELATARPRHEEFLVEADCPLIAPTGWADRPTVVGPDPRLVLAGDTIRCELPVALMERAATTGFQAANALLARWELRGHDLWTVPRQRRQLWPRRLRRLLAAAPTHSVQPGNSPRRRSSKRRSA